MGLGKGGVAGVGWGDSGTNDRGSLVDKACAQGSRKKQGDDVERHTVYTGLYTGKFRRMKLLKSQRQIMMGRMFFRSREKHVRRGGEGRHVASRFGRKKMAASDCCRYLAWRAPDFLGPDFLGPDLMGCIKPKQIKVAELKLSCIHCSQNTSRCVCQTDQNQPELCAKLIKTVCQTDQN